MLRYRLLQHLCNSKTVSRLKWIFVVPFLRKTYPEFALHDCVPYPYYNREVYALVWPYE
jgi:hypothetical protein